MVKGQGTVRRFTVDLGVGNIQNTGDSQQAAFHLTDTNHKGFILVCPTLGQFQEVTVDCFRDIGGNIIPTPFPLIVQIEGKVDGIFTHAFNPHHMADGGNAHTFTGVLKGVNCGLHLIHKGFRRLLEGTIDDHQLHGSAHGQLAIGSRRIHGIQPRLDFLGHTGKAADPSVGSRGRDQLGRVQIAVPNPIYLHTAHAGNGVHLFQIIRTVAAEGLSVQAIHVTLSENLGIFFILTGDHHGGNGTGFKAVHILNGNHRSGVVITGFTSGIAIIIALGQVDNFFGTHSVGTSALEKLWSYTSVGFTPNWQAVAIGLLVVLFMVFWPKKLNAKVPGSLLAIILATVVTEIAGFDSLAKVGDIPKSLMLDNRLNLGAVNLDMLQNLISPIVSIAMLGMIESLLCGASASRMKDEAFDADRELIAQGVGNILLPFFGGVPATAAIARTSVAIKSGEQTRVTGVVHSLVLLLAMVLLGGVMSRLPLSALAGVLMVTAWRMNEWHGIKTIFSRKVWTGVAQFLITMVSTVVFDLTVAIVIGIVTALMMFVWNAARLTIETEPVDKVRLERLHRMGKPVDESRAKSILVSYLNGSLFFANCADLKRKLLSVDFTGCEHLILSLRGVSATDISGVQTLMEVCALIAQKGVTVSICGVHENVAGFFQKVGLTDQLGAAAFYPNASEAVIDTLAQEQAGA